MALRWLVVLAALWSPCATLAQSAPVAPAQSIIETADEALAEDASDYARQFDVPLAEAMQRLAAQEASVPVTDTLAARYRDRLAGITIEHRPDYRIVVHLTGVEQIAPERLTIGGLTVPIIYQTGAAATREHVIWAMTYHQAAIRAALKSPPAIGLDPRTGELVVIIRSDEAASGTDAIRKKLQAIAGTPVQIRILDRIERNLSVKGGAPVAGINTRDGRRYACTTGFVVTDGVRDGVITAAHCPDTLTYSDVQHGATLLTFTGQWGWGYQDVQVNIGAEALPPLFYADSARTRARFVTGQRSHAATRVGDVVCHRGQRTGYSCALVELTDFAPAGDLCGGTCLPTWVTVAGPHCKGGDSGSPVFSGTTAFGIVKGASYRRDGSCAFYFYMSLDYMPRGWSVRLAHTGPPQTGSIPTAAPELRQSR